MNAYKPRPHLNKLLLAAIFLVQATSTVIWTLSDKTPPVWDPADHIIAGYDYYRFIAHLDFSGFAREFFVETHYYAPLVHLVTAAVMLVFGASRLTGIGVNFISLAVLLASVAWICRRLYSDESGKADTAAHLTAGVVAALIATSYHFTSWLLHDAFLDYPLTAIVTLSFALLIRAGDFTNRRDAILFGVAAGLGLLTKQTFAFFFVMPALYVLARVIRARKRAALLNVGIAAMIAVAIAAIWYGPHLKEVIEIYTINREAAVSENEAPPLSFMSNVFYWHALVSHQMQLPFGILFLAGLIHSLARRPSRTLMLYLWLASGLVIFSLVANKDLRYTVPVLPAAAIISVSWLVPVKKGNGAGLSEKAPGRGSYLELGLTAAVVIWAFVSFFNAQWPRDGSGYYLDTPRFRWMVFARNYFSLDHRPLPQDWSVPDIVRFMATHEGREVGGDATVPTIGVVVNLPHLNPSSVYLYARLLAQERAAPPLIQVDWLVTDSARGRIEQCKYLLVRTGLERADWVAPLERHAEELIRADPSRFTRIASFPIPLDGAEAVIYKSGQ